MIVFRRYSLTAGAVAFAHLEDSVPVIPRLRGGFHCLFPLSCFVVSCQPGQAAVRKVPARALWLEVLRRTWDATRCASKVRSQMTDDPYGYLRSDTNDTMLTLVFAWFRRSVALKLCILFASLQSLDVSWPSVVICGVSSLAELQSGDPASVQTQERWVYTGEGRGSYSQVRALGVGSCQFLHFTPFYVNKRSMQPAPHLCQAWEKRSIWHTLHAPLIIISPLASGAQYTMAQSGLIMK